ncbi:hypothetical protein ACFOQM_03625 [Paenibacillus sp. GCM10012307]|uniref:Uncharacterized protein n=1 Tax=Paenibacillus roseus TaxID=2798579 RepID=A0A934IZ87_9BACL|nr:hypothetical protein [Paenibacillus roseus]MBJ6360404.1 hypothetical protein [Paenibacillus roseus]
MALITVRSLSGRGFPWPTADHLVHYFNMNKRLLLAGKNRNRNEHRQADPQRKAVRKLVGLEVNMLTGGNERTA